MRKILALTGALAMTTLAACSSGYVESEDGTVEEGVLTVGLSPDFPPMEYIDDSNTLVGADIDLVNEMAKRLDLKVVFEKQKFDQLVNSVRTQRVDIVFSGMSDTVERQQTVDFVDYFKSFGQFYTIAQNAPKYTDNHDVCGHKVAVSEKTDYYTALQSFSDDCEADGNDAVTIIPADSGAAARLQLDQGRADLAVQGSENLGFFEQTDPGKYVVIGDSITELPFGAALRKGNTKLSESVEETFQAMYDDGTTKKILTEYGVQSGLMEPEINGVKE